MTAIADTLDRLHAQHHRAADAAKRAWSAYLDSAPGLPAHRAWQHYLDAATAATDAERTLRTALRATRTLREE